MCKLHSIKTHRMGKIVGLMRDRLITADEIAAKLGVSSRTVYRYVDDLRKDGAPILGEAGVGYMLRPREARP